MKYAAAGVTGGASMATRKVFGKDPSQSFEGGKFSEDPANMFDKPKAPGPSPAQLELERQQREQLTTLDDQENKRRKRLFSAMQGLRAFTGSALFRQQGASTARAASSAPAMNPGSGAGGGYGSMFDPGAGSGRSLIQP